MKRLSFLSICHIQRNFIFQALACLPIFLLLSFSQSKAEVMTKEQVIAEGDKLAEAQLTALNKNYWGRFWVDGVMWSGYVDFSKISPKGVYYRGEMKKMGERGKWELLFTEKEPLHADDICVGQVFLDLYEETKDPVMLKATQERANAITEAILSKEMEEKASKLKELPWNEGLIWYWCDALFMAAPVQARLTAITGDQKYLKAMHIEWERISSLLYDKEEQLFFRDKKYIDKKTKNGKKVFWARGNGWVVGALAHILPYIPKDDPCRERYVTQLKEMCSKLASIQRADGTWSPSLGDPGHFPFSESSGTSLNCFAIAWGINNGILDDATYRPVVAKAWAALMAARRPDGMLGYVQGVGSEPAGVHADQTVWYANGGFLMAAAQVAQMAPIDVPPPPTLMAAPRPPPKEKKP